MLVKGATGLTTKLRPKLWINIIIAFISYSFYSVYIVDKK